MSSYLVLSSPGAPIPDERSVVLADGLAWWAFAVPVLWLAFNRLWLEAAAAALVTLGAFTLAGSDGSVSLALTILLALGLLTGLEGRNRRVAALLRRGWRLVDLVETDDQATAFEIHAARASAESPAPAPATGPAPRDRPASARMPDVHAGSIGLVPVERT